jgi:dolichol kinase
MLKFKGFNSISLTRNRRGFLILWHPDCFQYEKLFSTHFLEVSIQNFSGHGRQRFHRRNWFFQNASFSENAIQRVWTTKVLPVFAVGFASPMRLHLHTDLHFARKAWHALMGSVIAWIYWQGMSVANGIFILSCFLVWDVSMELARLRIPSLNTRLLRIMGPLMRASEVNQMSGIPYYISASILAIALFPREVAVLSILYLAWGDPMASLWGILYGKKSYRFANGKSLIGTLGGVLTCCLISFLFFRSNGQSGLTLASMTLIGGIAGGTAELLPFEMDDNFTIPMISGFVLWVAFIGFGL